jgi:hypothetical protein
MNHAKTTIASAARWLVVLTTSVLVIAGSVFVPQPVSAKSACGVEGGKGCEVSCGDRCTCCVSKAPRPSSPAPAPIAPGSSARNSIAKDFQLAPLLNTLFELDRESNVAVRNYFFVPAFAAHAPLFVRHCTFLI